MTIYCRQWHEGKKDLVSRIDQACVPASNRRMGEHYRGIVAPFRTTGRRQSVSLPRAHTLVRPHRAIGQVGRTKTKLTSKGARSCQVQSERSYLIGQTTQSLLTSQTVPLRASATHQVFAIESETQAEGKRIYNQLVDRVVKSQIEPEYVVVPPPRCTRRGEIASLVEVVG